MYWFQFLLPYKNKNIENIFKKFSGGKSWSEVFEELLQYFLSYLND